MNAAGMMVGQLYLVHVRGTLRMDELIEKQLIILQARDAEEIQSKVRYMLDVSRYLTLAITSVEKIKPRFHVLRKNVFSPSDLKLIRLQIESPNAAPGSGQSQRTNLAGQVDGIKRFAFGLIGGISATDEDHVLRKIGKWLMAMGTQSDSKSPMYSGSRLICDEEGPQDSTVSTDSIIRGLDGTHFRDQKPLRGGGASPR